MYCLSPPMTEPPEGKMEFVNCKNLEYVWCGTGIIGNLYVFFKINVGLSYMNVI